MSRANAISRSAYNRAYLAKRRAELKAAGLCQWCGKAPAKPSPRGKGLGCRCAECASLSASKSRASMARKRPAWNALGICSQCGTRQAMPRTHICGVCAERRSEYQADHRKVPLLPRDPTLETDRQDHDGNQDPPSPETVNVHIHAPSNEKESHDQDQRHPRNGYGRAGGSRPRPQGNRGASD